jgi:outer membrane protein TolC
MIKLVTLLTLTILLNASVISQNDNTEGITLEEAINILTTQNLEIHAAQLDIKTAQEDKNTATGNHYGRLDFIQDAVRSNDAGNVFGFKLTSREANFGDFGADEFMNNFMAGHPDYKTPPDTLNNPGYRNFFQSKLKYEVPLFTGFKITSYENIMKSMVQMKSLEKDQVINEKKYQVRKSFYDMALLKNSIKNLTTIYNNITKLEETTRSMLDEGYAKKVDLLEVQAKKGDVHRLLNTMESNKQLLYHYISFLLNQKVTKIVTPPYDVTMPELSDEEILNNNLDIKRASTGLVVRKSMVDVADSSYYPMVGAFAEVATADDSFFEDAGSHKAYTFGARLTWNIFNGGIDGANHEKAKLQHLKTQTQVQLAKKGIHLKISKIRTEIAAFDLEIESLEKELNLANEIYKNYEGRYMEKLSSMSDVIIKQSAQIQKILELQIAHNKRNERIFALENLANGEYK